MLKVNERTLADNPSLLAQWVTLAIGLAGMRVKIRLRGNKLHILCEGRECPDKQTVLNRLIQALNVTKLSELLPTNQPPLKQLLLYGRVSGRKRPAWTELIDLKQLEQLQLWQRRQAEAARKSKERGVRSEGYYNSLSHTPRPLTAEEEKREPSLKELARTGHPSAIARYLGETLKPLGVRVKVVAKALPDSPDSGSGGSRSKESYRVPSRRLWVACESAYSPDPSLLAAPVAQQLRELHLKGFQDAVILSQVTGEATPDWMLRVDLTPPEEMLQEWCRWGDPAAIARLLNQALTPEDVEVSAVLKDSTLHISCIATGRHGKNSQLLPDKSTCVREIALMLLSLAPQGIHAATIYGHETAAAPPIWVDWLNLPALKSPTLAKSALDLAREWDEEAIAFLLGRFLNRDLDWRLATGGIRIQVRFKEDLLHIMSDAPVCPSQRLVAAPSAQFVRQMDIPDIAGVRVYGRRAGQKQPLWSYGVDFITRTRQEPEATPEFPKSEAFADDELLTEEPDEPIRPEALHPSDFKTASQQTVREIVQFIVRQLVRSQLFALDEETRNFDPALPEPANGKGVRVALVWMAVGILLTVSVDLVMGQLLEGKVNPRLVAPISAIPQSGLPYGRAALDDNSELPETGNLQESDNTVPLSHIPLPQSRNPKEAAVFNGSGFTQLGAQMFDESVPIGTESSPYPSFNNPQLDRKLLLYRQRLEEKGPPDVLIIGSSRALRGIDPTALAKALASQGYGQTEVFNFGINGATAQVVDLLLRRILTPEQLPKLIIWADGARAFNSGRSDNTFQSIEASVGYQKLVAGALPRANSLDEKPFNSLEPFTVTPIVPGSASNVWAVGSRNLDEWLNQFLMTVSATYPQRDRLQSATTRWLNSTFNPRQLEPAKETQKLAAERLKNWNGFLPVSIRFNPTTYYRKHSRVAGEYDSDYKNFKLGGSQAIALQSLLQFTQANQIPLVFVNLPLTQEYLDPVRRQYEQEFELSMVRLALGQEFVFRNWSQLWPTKNEYFSDPSHLNRYGAAAVSIRLAQDPLIPWPKSNK